MRNTFSYHFNFRPSELAPPPQEMPSWQQQRQGQAHNAQNFQTGSRNSHPAQQKDYNQQQGGYQHYQGGNQTTGYDSQDRNPHGYQNDGRKFGGKGQNRNRGVQGGGWKKERHY